MTILSGCGLVVDGDDTVARWQINHATQPLPYRVHRAPGGSLRTATRPDWFGAYWGYGYEPAVWPGDAFTFTGSVDGEKGVTGKAICSSIRIFADLERWGLVNYVVQFAADSTTTADLAWDVASLTDTSIPDPPSARWLEVQLDQVAETDVSSVDLLIATEPMPYATHYDYPGVTQRAGGGLDVRLTWKKYEGLPENLDGVAGTDYDVRLVVNEANQFWHFHQLTVERVSDYIVDARAQKPIGCTMLATMDGQTSDSPANLGYIFTPGLNKKWPI